MRSHERDNIIDVDFEGGGEKKIGRQEKKEAGTQDLFQEQYQRREYGKDHRDIPFACRDNQGEEIALMTKRENGRKRILYRETTRSC